MAIAAVETARVRFTESYRINPLTSLDCHSLSLKNNDTIWKDCFFKWNAEPVFGHKVLFMVSKLLQQ